MNIINFIGRIFEGSDNNRSLDNRGSTVPEFLNRLVLFCLVKVQCLWLVNKHLQMFGCFTYKQGVCVCVCVGGGGGGGGERDYYYYDIQK